MDLQIIKLIVDENIVDNDIYSLSKYSPFVRTDEAPISTGPLPTENHKDRPAKYQHKAYIKLRKQCSFKFGILSENKTLIQGVSLQVNTLFLGHVRNAWAYIFSNDQMRHYRTAKIVFQPAARVQYRGC